MRRRHFLQGLTASAMSGCAASLPPAPPAATPRSLPPMPAAFGGFAGSPPVIDFHTHLQRGIAAGDLIRLMDESGVARLVLMPLYYGDGGGAVNDGEGSDQQALDYARRHPERLVPFCGMQRSELNRPEAWSMSADARRILAETDSKLASGAFFGLGELMLRFYPYTNRFGIRAVSDMDHPVFSPLMRHFADLSAKHRAPMVVHAEAEPHVAAGMRRLLEAHPEAVVVWSHNCGRSSAAAIAEMMARHRNLHADLGGMVYSGPQVEHYGVYYPRRTPWMHLVVDAAGIVADDMKPVFERFADRFVIGTDIAHARVYARYAGHWPRWRSFFGQLSAATAEAIAWRNADRLIRG